MNVLLDEQSQPPLRHVLGQLLLSATSVEIAVSNIHLAMIDLTAEQLDAIGDCRILVQRVEARSLRALGVHGRAERGTDLRALRNFISSNRVEIRSAGVGSWSPDFSLYRKLRTSAAMRDICLIGAHYFHVPVAHYGPSFTCVLSSKQAVAAALRRFDALWDSAHDIRDAVDAALRMDAVHAD